MNKTMTRIICIVLALIMAGSVAMYIFYALAGIL